jgi:hypothetical protein
MQKSIGNFWPTDRSDDLIRELSGEGRLRAFTALAQRMDGIEGIEWINTKLDQGEITSEDVKSLEENGELTSILAQMDAPLDDRIALMQRLGVAPAEITHAYKAQRFIHRDISNYLFDGNADDDWLFWFRSGEVSAKQVYDAVLEHIPDPGSEMKEFKSQMFRHLAEEDPTRALELYADVPQNAQDWQKAYATRWWFTGTNPDDFYQLTSSISYKNDPKMQKFLRQSWTDKSGINLERYGEGYVEWVESLPEGRDRQWALEGLEHASRDKAPGIHREVIHLLDSSK